jgi:hypothetical protein
LYCRAVQRDALLDAVHISYRGAVQTRLNTNGTAAQQWSMTEHVVSKEDPKMTEVQDLRLL